MRRMRFAERAVFFQLELVRHGFLVFCRRVVALLAGLTGQRNGISHFLCPSESSRDEPGCLINANLLPRSKRRECITR